MSSNKSSKMKYVYGVIVVLLLAAGGFSVLLKASPVSLAWWGVINTSDGLANKGYDPVAYQKDGKAQKGDASINHRWKGVTWYFASAENQSLFQNSPAEYAPQFGGYCASAVSVGLTIDVDPEAWHVENNKLYLFFDSGAKDDFIAKIPGGVISDAEGNWVHG